MSKNNAIKINLLKFQGACVINLKGKTETKECLVIPIEDAHLFKGEKGVYANLTAIGYNEPKYQDTHFIKRSLSKEEYDAMTEEQRNAEPILGGMHPIERVTNPVAATNTVDISSGSGEGEDLPF